MVEFEETNWSKIMLINSLNFECFEDYQQYILKLFERENEIEISKILKNVQEEVVSNQISGLMNIKIFWQLFIDVALVSKVKLR